MVVTIALMRPVLYAFNVTFENKGMRDIMLKHRLYYMVVTMSLMGGDGGVYRGV